MLCTLAGTLARCGTCCACYLIGGLLRRSEFYVQTLPKMTDKPTESVTYGDRVAQAAELVQNTYASVGDAVKPYAGAPLRAP